MNKLLFTAVAVSAAGFLLSGCSKDKVLSDQRTSASNAIGFNPGSSNTTLSRAIPVDDKNLKDLPFDVFAFFTGNGQLFMGYQKSLEYGDGNIYDWHEGVKVKWKSTSETAGEWVYDNPEDQAYWPSEALTFYAVYPAVTDISQYGWVVKHDTQKIYYATWGDEFSASDGNKNVDVMYAIAPGITKETNNGTVKLDFRHTLSQVLFNARKELKSMEVNIKSIHIGNIRVAGIFTFPGADDDPSADNWDTNGEMTDRDKNEFLVHPKLESAASLTWNEEENKANTVMISSTANVMMPIPQELVKWNTNKPIVAGDNTASGTSAKADGESYLHIRCQIKKNDTYYVGKEGTADEDYGDVYVPFAAKWEPGKRYIYTLVFGGGYDAGGKPILTPVKITADQTDWENSVGSEVAL